MNEYNEDYSSHYAGEDIADYREEPEFREIDRQKKIRKKKHYLLRFLIVLGVLAGTGLFLASGFFDIDTILVEGNHYYADDQVINMAGAKKGVNLFWGAGGSDIEDNLCKNPYFAEVNISRKLPRTLIINVKERRQMAAFTYGDSYIIIDADGTVLRKSDVDPKLTLLTGLTISKLKISEKIGCEEKATLDTTLKMLETMQAGDIFFKKIDVSKVIIKAYIYDTLIVKGTPKQMMKSMERGDLQKVVNNLFENQTTRGTINLGDHNYMSFSPDF